MKESLDSWAPPLVIQRASPPGGLLEGLRLGGGTLTCRTSPRDSHKNTQPSRHRAEPEPGSLPCTSSAELPSCTSSDQARGSSEQQSVSGLSVCHVPCAQHSSGRTLPALCTPASNAGWSAHRGRPQRVFSVNFCQYLQNVRVPIQLWFSGFS